jgi:DNA-binding NarL/FixJ family response regulator
MNATVTRCDTAQNAKPSAAIAVAVFCAEGDLRERLLELLHKDASLVVVGASDQASELRQLVDRARPAVVLADKPPPQWRVGRPRQANNPAALVVLADDNDAEAWVDALDAGAQAVLPQTSCAGDIINALKLAAGGYFVLPPDVVSQLRAAGPFGDRSPDRSEPARVQLTPRELEVLGAMANGASNKAIARQLGISFHTAKFHVAALLAKLDAESRTEAVTKAAQMGLVML